MAHAWDAEQKEMLKDFWKRQGRFIVLALVLGAVLGWGWRMWQQHVLYQSAQASSSYEALQAAFTAHDTKRVAALATYLQTQHAGTPYAAAGMLVRARDLVAVGAWADAKKALDWVVAQSKKMPALRQVARLELARLDLLQHDPQSALSAISVVDVAAYQPWVDRVRSEALRQLGKKQDAQDALKASAAGFLQEGVGAPFERVMPR